jgi:hypothetical protein
MVDRPEGNLRTVFLCPDFTRPCDKIAQSPGTERLVILKFSVIIVDCRGDSRDKQPNEMALDSDIVAGAPGSDLPWGYCGVPG